MMINKPIYQTGTPERRLVYAWEGEVDGLKAENERLRAVLRAIMQLDGRNDLPDARTIARAALEPQT